MPWRRLTDDPPDQPGSVSRQWASVCQGALRIDPYLVWSDLTCFHWARTQSPQWLPFVIETTGGANALEDDVAASVPACGGQAYNVIRIPTAYRRQITPGGRQSRFLTALVHCDEVLAIAALPSVRRMKLGLARRGGADISELFENYWTDVLLQWPDGFSRSEYRALPIRAAADKKVVLGVIDDGCNFAHPAYRVGAGSRVVRLWDQNDDCQPWSGKPRFLGYGRVLAESDIRTRLAAHAGERAVYQDIYSDRPDAALPRANGTHGTGAMHLLAGACRLLPQSAECDPQPPLGADIMFVQLPGSTLDDTSSVSLCVHALDAIRYVIDRAETYAPIGDGPGDPAAQARVMRKVVINLSYGSMSGPHDGSAVLDEAIEELATERGDLAVVVAAGNSRRSRCHAVLDLDASAHAHIGWVACPANPVPSTLEIWAPADDVQVQLTDPHGNASAWALTGELHALRVAGRDAAWIIRARHQAVGAPGCLIMLAIAPTAVDPDGSAHAPHGTWQVSLRHPGGVAMQAQVWVERNDMAHARLRRQQAYLVDWDAPSIRTEGTMCSPASSHGAVAVAARVWSTGHLADYSGEGWDAGKAGAEASATVDRGPSVKGMRVDGVVSGTSLRMSGTSAAAPLVARRLAQWMMGQAGRLDWPTIASQARSMTDTGASAALPPIDPRSRTEQANP